MKTLHVDDFAALNDEIRALAHAGIPLPEGLRAASEEYPGRVGSAAEAIARRLESGQPLEDALVKECGMSAVYATVIAAGLKSGRLAQALEGVVDSARRVVSLRRLILVSLTYPTLLVLLAYGLAVFLLGRRELYVADLYEWFRLGPSPFGFYSTLYSSMAFWVWIPPVLIGVALLWFVWTAGRGGSETRFQLPLLRKFVRSGRIASFLELLRLLVENESPLDEACRLAARASADEGLRRSGEELADKLRDGVRNASPSGNQIPPMIQWLILSGATQDTLVSILERSANAYRRRTERMASWMSIYIPLLLSFVIGGGTTVLFGAFVLLPWFHFLVRLGATA